MKKCRYFYLAMSLLLIVLTIHITAFAEEPEAGLSDLSSEGGAVETASDTSAPVTDDSAQGEPQGTADVPVSTETPEATAAPETTAVPETTAAPEATAAPETTAAPATTEASETTAAPAPTTAEATTQAYREPEAGTVSAQEPTVAAETETSTQAEDVLDPYYDSTYAGYSYTSYDPFISSADIVEEEEIVRDESEYRELVDKILVHIITPDMTDEERCKAVYDYVHEIPYVNVVYSKNWKENGYRMLYDRAGDCFGFYSASRLLLERLGYSVVEAQNQNGFTHVWCLVSIDKGRTWLHFDPTNWSWGDDGDLCLLTDEEITEYGTRHQVGYQQLSHDWNREQAEEEIRACREQLKTRIYLLYPEETAQAASIES